MSAAIPGPEEGRGVPFNPQDIDTHADFAALLTEARLNAGLSIRDVARRTAIPVSTLGGYFGGRHLPAPNRPEILRGLLTAMAVPATDHERWERALRRAFQGRRASVRSASPYPGLRAYQPADAEAFFGRQQAKEALLAIVHRSYRESDQPIVVVTGASGSGKSSLLRAGIVPALAGWDIAVMEPGADPAQEYTRLEPADPRRAACILIDQAEGLWSKASPTSREEFLQRLTAWVRPSPTWGSDGADADRGTAPPRVAIFSLRADFYSQAAENPSLREALQENHFILAPLTSTELAEVIVEPARLAGAAVRPELVSAIVHESLTTSHGEGSFLPHVAHCLSRMWSQREGPELTLELYERTGGIGAVLRESAESTWESLEESERPVARRLLLDMVQADPGLPRTSRSVPIDGLSQTELAVLDTFAAARVVSVVEDSASLAHEAIITAWPRLRDWVEQDIERLTMVRRLEREAEVWVAADREEDLLLRGSRLLAYQDLSDDGDDLLGAPEAEYLAASRDLATREEVARARRQRQQKGLLMLVSALAAAALIAVIGYVGANRQLSRERDAAASRQLAALATEAGETDSIAASGLALAALRKADTVEATSAVLAGSALGEVTRFTGPIGQRMVTGSPDGRILASSEADGEIVIYEVDDDVVRESARLPGPQTDGQGTVFALAFSPDGRYLAAGGTSGSVRLIDLSDPDAPGDPVDLAAGGTVYALAWPDEATLYAGTQNPGLLQWERDGEEFTPGPGASTEHAVLSLTTDGTRLAAGDDVGTVSVWPLEAGRAGAPVTASLSQLGIASVGFQGTDLLVGGRDRVLLRVPIADGAFGEPVELTRFGSWVNAITTTEGYVAAGSSDSTVRVWRSEADTTGRTIGFSAPVTALQPVEGNRLAVSLTNGDLHVVQLARALVYPGPGNVFTTQFSANGERLLVVPGIVNRLSVFDMDEPTDPALLLRIDGDEESGFNGVGGISPDGRLVVAARRDGVLLGFDISDPARPEKVFSEKVSQEMPEQVVFAPSGDFVVVGSDEGAAHVVTLTGDAVEAVETLTGPTNYVLNVGISPDETQIAAASLDGFVHRWVRDGDSWVAADPLEVGTAVLTLAFDPTGTLLAASGSDPVVRVWDLSGDQPELAAELTGPDNEVYQVAFSRDGRLAAASLDQSLTIWEPAEDDDESGAYSTYAVLRPGSGSLYATGWAPDGERVVAGGVDGAVHVWDVDPEAIRERVCGIGGDLLSQEEWDKKVGGLAYESPCD